MKHYKSTYINQLTLYYLNKWHITIDGYLKTEIHFAVNMKNDQFRLVISKVASLVSDVFDYAIDKNVTI